LFGNITVPGGTGLSKEEQAKLVAALEGAEIDVDILGNAATASKLETPRNIQVDLESESAGSFDGSADANPGVKGILPIKHGGTGNAEGKVKKAETADKATTAETATKATTAETATKATTAETAGSATKATSATKLETARNLHVDLSLTSPAAFNGEADATMGVKGVLPLANGGLGANNAEGARQNIEAAPAYSFGTEDLEEGVSELAHGRIYLVYELPEDEVTDNG